MRYYVANAFAEHDFSGNPAGICLLDSWLPDDKLQNIAIQNNLSETAFLVKKQDCYHLRWFSVTEEIDLCGHATLASAFVLMNYIDTQVNELAFETMSGMLYVRRNGDKFTMEFPSRAPVVCEKPEILEQALGMPVLETYLSRDLVAVVESESAVQNAQPDFSLLRQIKDAFAVIVTAKGNSCDFVSRFFAPNAGMDEDPVTGSAHCTLIPFWRDRLQKTEMVARQLSQRGGTIYCKDLGERVEISGQAKLYLQGEILLKD